MATDLVVYGPFDIPFDTKGGLDKYIGGEHRAAFKGQLTTRGLARKDGCYVFSTRAGRGFTPWYVGKSTKGLGDECLADNKLRIFNDHLRKGSHKGTPVMFFIAPPGGKNAIDKRVCDEVETFLIQAAHAKNEKLLNKRKKSVLYWNIAGVVGDGLARKSQESTIFRKMIGL